MTNGQFVGVSVTTREPPTAAPPATPAAGTLVPVRDDRGFVSEDDFVVPSLLHGDDADAVEHLRQDRLRRWQSQP